jgi:hypothetical protein
MILKGATIQKRGNPRRTQRGIGKGRDKFTGTGIEEVRLNNGPQGGHLLAEKEFSFFLLQFFEARLTKSIKRRSRVSRVKGTGIWVRDPRLRS